MFFLNLCRYLNYGTERTSSIVFHTTSKNIFSVFETALNGGIRNSTIFYGLQRRTPFRPVFLWLGAHLGQ